MLKRIYIIAAMALSSYSNHCYAQVYPDPVPLATDVYIPWELEWGPDNHIWFTEKRGRVCRLNPDTRQLYVIHFEDQVKWEYLYGMLGMALHPDFGNNPYVYIAYNYGSGPNAFLKVARYRYDAANDTLTGRTDIISGIRATYGQANHFGCRLLIDGDKLFVTTGDIGNLNLPQDMASLNGKILRYNLDGTVPADNPVAGSPVWALGFRNPQGLVKIGDNLFCSEHGESTDDEINIVLKGRNYGWPDVSGYCDLPSEQSFCTDNNVVEPIETWTPNKAPSGIAYYGNHSALPSLQNAILVATLTGLSIEVLHLNPARDAITSRTTIDMSRSHGRIRDICVSPEGRVFASTSIGFAPVPNDPPPFIEDRIFELKDPLSLRNTTGEEGFKVYPNPTMGSITVGMPNVTGKERYAIYDPTGRLVSDGLLDGERQEINLEKVNSGMYHLRITSSDGKLLKGLTFQKQ